MDAVFRYPRSTRSRDLECATIAGAQHGVISRAQALEAGMSSQAIHRRVTSGLWQRILPEVYRLHGFPQTWRQRLMAACLRAGGAAAGRAAAKLWGLGGFEDEVIEVSTPIKSKRTVGKMRVHRVTAVATTVIDGIPVTTAPQTLLDLAASVSSKTLEIALDSALSQGLVSVERLLERIGKVGRRRGVATLRRLLLGRRSRRPSESILETKLLQLIRRSGLPLPEAQYEVWDSARLVARVDFAYPDARLAIEALGLTFHTGKEAVQKDSARAAALAAVDWRLLPITWDDLNHRAGEKLTQIRRALQSRSL